MQLDPHWLHDVQRVTPAAIELSVVLTTRTGEPWATQHIRLDLPLIALERCGNPLDCNLNQPCNGAHHKR